MAAAQRLRTGRVAPTSADVVVNSVWKGRRLISAAGGGVSIYADQALTAENMKVVERAKFDEPRRATTALPADQSRWWWD
jgi:hypothetical protein